MKLDSKLRPTGRYFDRGFEYEVHSRIDWGIAIVALTLIGVPMASAAPTTGAETAKRVVLEQFRENLTAAADAGDVEAIESVESFDSLTQQQRLEL